MVRCPHKECSESDKEFESDFTMRQHHTKVHDEQLPNCECSECGKDFFEKGAKKKYCNDCGHNAHYVGENNPNYKGKVEYVEDLKERSTCSGEDCDESRPVALCFHHKPEYEK